ncbi:MAG TPA: inorganic phosphate transporter [Nitrospiria bacterium]|nr:inorganic phosphate transporter [Nitrospiria bacterium]
MSGALAFILFSVFWLAYANGANDNFKGVATLFGSGTTDYRRALWWATGTTFLGSMTAVAFGNRLIETFSGKGLVPDAAVADPALLAAVGLGAAGTVFLATRFCFPISTTHALVGALIGAGLVSSGLSGINLHGLGSLFLVPLLVSPLLALGLAGIAYPLLHRLRLALGISRETCVCIGEEVQVIAVEPGHANAAAMVAVADRVPSVTVGTDQTCFERYHGTLVGINVQTVLDRLHYLSAGAVSFARGLNDTPKILALLITVQAFHLPLGVGLVGIAIALGGLINARRIAETMSHRITGMNHGQGLTANLVTAALVLGASKLGMPVSTTHVSCGTLFGIGAVSGQARWRMIGAIILAWVTTLPVAALAALIVRFVSV